jgi:hypothetical protein
MYTLFLFAAKSNGGPTRSKTMGGCSGKVADLTAKNQVHPIVERLVAGLVIYSQSFMGDFWLVYKNSHIVVSCFAAHRAHYFTGSERYYVMLVSIFWAFFLSALFAWTGKSQSCQKLIKEQYKEQYGNRAPINATQVYGKMAEDCLRDPSVLTPMESAILFSIISSLVQLFYDSLAKFLVTCGCVQNCNNCIKNCAEGLGKMTFWCLALVAIAVLIAGWGFIIIMGGNFALTFGTFIITKLFNFCLVTSLILFVTFAMARRAQMKPPASALATPEGRARWEAKPKALCPCLSSDAPCDMWNKHIGADKSFEDLPKTPPDYDFDIQISLLICCCTYTMYEYKAQNPMEQNQMLSMLPPGWQACQDPQSGRTYYQNTVTQTTQWHPPGAAASDVESSCGGQPATLPPQLSIGNNLQYGQPINSPPSNQLYSPSGAPVTVNCPPSNQYHAPSGAAETICHTMPLPQPTQYLPPNLPPGYLSRARASLSLSLCLCLSLSLSVSVSLSLSLSLSLLRIMTMSGLNKSA